MKKDKIRSEISVSPGATTKRQNSKAGKNLLLKDVAEETNDSNEDIGHTSRLRNHDHSVAETHVGANKSK